MMTNQNTTPQAPNNAPHRPSFALFHPNPKGTGCGITMNLHPAHDFVDGCIMLTMMPQKTIGSFQPGQMPTFATFDSENPLCVKLGFADLTAMLAVFRGETESIGEGKGLYHRCPQHTSSIRLKHVIDQKPGYALEIYQSTPGKPAEDRSAYFFMTSQEALGVSIAIEHSLGLVCFGIPMIIPHDTSDYRRQVREARHGVAA